MATSGPNYPGSASDDASIGSVSWSNVAHVEADDGVVATASVPNGSATNYLKASNFGFSIPTASNVTSIKIEVKAGQSSSGATDNSCKLVKGGVISGSDFASGATPAASPAYIEYDGTGGLSLTDTDVNDSGFGVVWSGKFSGAGGSVISVDAIRLTLTYSPAGPSPITVFPGVAIVTVVVLATEGTRSEVPGLASVTVAAIGPSITLGTCTVSPTVPAITLDVPDLAIIRGAVIVGAGVASIGVHADAPALLLTISVHPGAAEVGIVLQNPAPLVFGEPFTAVVTVAVVSPAVTLSALSAAAGAVDIFVTIQPPTPSVPPPTVVTAPTINVAVALAGPSISFGATKPAAGVAIVTVSAVNAGGSFSGAATVTSISTGMNVFVPPLNVTFGDLPPTAGIATITTSVVAPTVINSTAPITGLAAVGVVVPDPTITLSALAIVAPIQNIAVAVAAPTITLGPAQPAAGVASIAAVASGLSVMPQLPGAVGVSITVAGPAVGVTAVATAAGVASIAVAVTGQQKISEAVFAVDVGVSIVSTHAPTNAPPVAVGVSAISPTFSGVLALNPGVAIVGVVVTSATANGVPYGLPAGVANVGVVALGTTWRTECLAGVAVVGVAALSAAISPDGYAGAVAIGVAVVGPLVSPAPLAGVAVVSIAVPSGPAWAAASAAVVTVSAVGPTWLTAALAGPDNTGVSVVSPSVVLSAIQPPIGAAAVAIDVSQQATALAGLTDAVPQENVGVSITAPTVVLGTATATAGVATVGASAAASSATISGTAEPAAHPVEIGVSMGVVVSSQGVPSTARAKATWIPAQRPTVWTLPKRTILPRS